MCVITTSCEPATFETAAFELAPAHPVLMPSCSVRESEARAPCMLPAVPPVPPVMPPESPLVLIPGTSAWMPVAFLDVGIAAMTSRSMIGLHPRALDVDDRRFAGDRDRLFERADSQIGVDRGDEVAAQLDAFALHRVETGQRERHGVGAGTKIDDAILTGVVADDRAVLLDQDGTGRFNRDARQHRAGRILDDAGDGGLRERSRGKQQDHQEGRHRSPREDTHRVPPPMGFPGKTGRDGSHECGYV